MTPAAEVAAVRAQREEARRTRWYWTLPVEAGYAASMIEVQTQWSLDDVYLVLDRLEARRKAAQRRAQEAKRGDRR